MKRVIMTMAGLVLPALCLSACAGDPAALARAVKALNEGCERSVDLSLDTAQPGGATLRVTRACASATDPAPPSPNSSGPGAL